MDTSARAAGFGERHFGRAELGDRRRRVRLVRLADLLVQHPGGTLPDKCKRPLDLKALYRLMNQDAVTHASVLAPSVADTTERMAAADGVAGHHRHDRLRQPADLDLEIEDIEAADAAPPTASS